MKMHYSHQLSASRISQIIGTFVLVPLLVLVLAGIFMAKAEHLFERTYLLRTSLSKSYGLEPGAPVVVSGIRVGRVEQVDLNARGTVDVVLRVLVRYQNMVKANSELSITKSGIVVGQTQVEIGVGTEDSPILQAGATIAAVEPRDVGQMINDLQPVLAAVKQTLLRVDTITQDLQGTVKAGGQALEQVAIATQQLPTLIASVQRTVASVEQTARSLPDMTGSITRTLGAVDRVTGNVQDATKRIPAIIDSTEEVLQSVKSLSASANDLSQELVPAVRTAHQALGDLSLLLRGAKNTFPFSRFVENAGPAAPPTDARRGLRSLRADTPTAR